MTKCPTCSEMVLVKFNKNCGPLGDFSSHRKEGVLCIESGQPVKAEPTRESRLKGRSICQRQGCSCVFNLVDTDLGWLCILHAHEAINNREKLAQK